MGCSRNPCPRLESTCWLRCQVSGVIVRLAISSLRESGEYRSKITSCAAALGCGAGACCAHAQRTRDARTPAPHRVALFIPVSSAVPGPSSQTFREGAIGASEPLQTAADVAL